MKALCKRKIWSQGELEYVKSFYPTTATATIALHLGRNVSSVYNMAHFLKVSKTPEYLSEAQRQRLPYLTRAAEATRFKKGQVPPNKGTKGLTGANRTSFKKGQKPHNYRPPGSYRVDVDGYLMLKIEDPRTWKYVHRMNYEEAFGPIPKGHVVSFRDGNKMNCDLSNLVLLTQEENMLRNTIQRFPEELKTTIKTLSKLKKTINKHGTKQN